MSKIYVQAEGPILLEDTSCPIFVYDRSSDKPRTLLFKDLHDAAALTGVPREKIVAIADNDDRQTSQGVQKDTTAGFSFIWPELKDIKKAWPSYKVHRPGKDVPFAIAVPCEVTLKTRPGSKKREKLYYRSITSTCTAWSITKETLDRIANQHLGWRDALPSMMASIRTGVKPPKDYVQDGEAESGPLFKLKDTKGGIVIDATALIGKKYPRVQDLPAAILASADWGSRTARKG